MKECHKCHITKEHFDFRDAKRNADKLTNLCKDCLSIQSKQRRQQNRDRDRARTVIIKARMTGTPKKCSKCQETKDRTQFNNNNSAHDGLATMCRICSNQYTKKYTDLYASQHHTSSGTKCCTKCNEIKLKLDFPKHHGRKDGFDLYCKSCTDEMKLSITAQVRALLNRAKHRANKNELDYNLDYDFIVTLLNPSIEAPICPVFGFVMEWQTLDKRGHVYKHLRPSIDRIDNTKGYTKDNVAVISTKANTLKRGASKKEIQLLSEWIGQY